MPPDSRKNLENLMFLVTCFVCVCVCIESRARGVCQLQHWTGTFVLWGGAQVIHARSAQSSATFSSSFHTTLHQKQRYYLCSLEKSRWDWIMKTLPIQVTTATRCIAQIKRFRSCAWAVACLQPVRQQFVWMLKRSRSVEIRHADGSLSYRYILP